MKFMNEKTKFRPKYFPKEIFDTFQVFYKYKMDKNYNNNARYRCHSRICLQIIGSFSFRFQAIFIGVRDFDWFFLLSIN